MAPSARVPQAYFKMINATRGGINGRRISLIGVGDGYSPPKTVEQIRKLVEQDQVLATFNTLGTAPNSAIHKYMNAKKVPHLLLSTGATKWGDPKNYPWTIGFNLSYQSEGMIYAKWLLKNKPSAKIAVLYQNDDYGKDVLKGVKDGLGAKAATMIIKEATYEVSDPTVDSQILTLQSSGADTFINITTPKFAAQAIRKAYDSGWKPLHIVNNVGASIGSVLTPAGLDKSKDLMTLQYYKDPNDPQWKDDPAMLEWRAFMGRYYRDGDPKDASNMYGYLTAQVMVQILKQCGNDLTRENVDEAMAANPEELQAAAALARHGHQHQPDRLLPDRAGAAGQVHRHAVARLRRGDRRRRLNLRCRGFAEPPSGGSFHLSLPSISPRMTSTPSTIQVDGIDVHISEERRQSGDGRDDPRLARHLAPVGRAGGCAGPTPALRAFHLAGLRHRQANPERGVARRHGGLLRARGRHGVARPPGGADAARLGLRLRAAVRCSTPSACRAWWQWMWATAASPAVKETLPGAQAAVAGDALSAS